MILYKLGFQRIQAVALLVALYAGPGDMRWTAAALGVRSFSAMWAFVQAQLLPSVRGLIRGVGRCHPC